MNQINHNLHFSLFTTFLNFFKPTFFYIFKLLDAYVLTYWFFHTKKYFICEMWTMRHAYRYFEKKKTFWYLKSIWLWFVCLSLLELHTFLQNLCKVRDMLKKRCKWYMKKWCELPFFPLLSSMIFKNVDMKLFFLLMQKRKKSAVLFRRGRANIKI